MHNPEHPMSTFYVLKQKATADDAEEPTHVIFENKHQMQARDCVAKHIIGEIGEN